MATTTTISVRVPKETQDWLERRTRKMGTVGTAAARLLEEARRREAGKEGFVLVTFDVNTIPPVLSDFAVAGEIHGGVVFVSSKSFAQNDFKSLSPALVRLANRHGDSHWENHVGFLEKS